MLKHHLNRLIALLLVPCLLADPAASAASGLRVPALTVSSIEHSARMAAFNEQALVAVALGRTRSILDRGVPFFSGLARKMGLGTFLRPIAAPPTGHLTDRGSPNALVTTSLAGWLYSRLPEGRLRAWVGTRLGPRRENRRYLYRAALAAVGHTIALLILAKLPVQSIARMSNGDRLSILTMPDPSPAYLPLENFIWTATRCFLEDHDEVFYGTARDTRPLEAGDSARFERRAWLFARQFSILLDGAVQKKFGIFRLLWLAAVELRGALRRADRLHGTHNTLGRKHGTALLMAKKGGSTTGLPQAKTAHTAGQDSADEPRSPAGTGAKRAGYSFSVIARLLQTLKGNPVRARTFSRQHHLNFVSRISRNLLVLESWGVVEPTSDQPGTYRLTPKARQKYRVIMALFMPFLKVGRGNPSIAIREARDHAIAELKRMGFQVTLTPPAVVRTARASRISAAAPEVTPATIERRRERAPRDIRPFRNLGLRIHRYRLLRNLTQRQLAELVGLNKQDIGNMEYGLYAPRDTVLAALALILIDDLQERDQFKNWAKKRRGTPSHEDRRFALWVRIRKAGQSGHTLQRMSEGVLKNELAELPSSTLDAPECLMDMIEKNPDILAGLHQSQRVRAFVDWYHAVDTAYRNRQKGGHKPLHSLFIFDKDLSPRILDRRKSEAKQMMNTLFQEVLLERHQRLSPPGVSHPGRWARHSLTGAAFPGTGAQSIQQKAAQDFQQRLDAALAQSRTVLTEAETRWASALAALGNRDFVQAITEADRALALAKAAMHGGANPETGQPLCGLETIRVTAELRQMTDLAQQIETLEEKTKTWITSRAQTRSALFDLSEMAAHHGSMTRLDRALWDAVRFAIIASDIIEPMRQEQLDELRGRHPANGIDGLIHLINLVLPMAVPGLLEPAIMMVTEGLLKSSLLADKIQGPTPTLHMLTGHSPSFTSRATRVDRAHDKLVAAVVYLIKADVDVRRLFINIFPEHQSYLPTNTAIGSHDDSPESDLVAYRLGIASMGGDPNRREPYSSVEVAALQPPGTDRHIPYNTSYRFGEVLRRIKALHNGEGLPLPPPGGDAQAVTTQDPLVPPSVGPATETLASPPPYSQIMKERASTMSSLRDEAVTALREEALAENHLEHAKQAVGRRDIPSAKDALSAALAKVHAARTAVETILFRPADEDLAQELRKDGDRLDKLIAYWLPADQALTEMVAIYPHRASIDNNPEAGVLIESVLTKMASGGKIDQEEVVGLVAVRKAIRMSAEIPAASPAKTLAAPTPKVDRNDKKRASQKGGAQRRAKKKLMPSPVLDADGRLQETDLAVDVPYILLRRPAEGSQSYGWEIYQSQGLDPERSKLIATLLSHGEETHLRSEQQPGRETKKVPKSYSFIRLEIRRHSTEEETFFIGRSRRRSAAIILDPSLFKPGKEVNLQGALYQAGGWLVHGQDRTEEELTAQTWMALLSRVPLEAFLTAYGHLPLAPRGEGTTPQATTLREVFNALFRDQMGLSERALRDRADAHHPEHADLTFLMEGIVSAVLDELYRQFPELFKTKRRYWMPVGVPPGAPEALTPERQILHQILQQMLDSMREEANEAVADDPTLDALDYQDLVRRMQVALDKPDALQRLRNHIQRVLTMDQSRASRRLAQHKQFQFIRWWVVPSAPSKTGFLDFDTPQPDPGESPWWIAPLAPSETGSLDFDAPQPDPRESLIRELESLHLPQLGLPSQLLHAYVAMSIQQLENGSTIKVLASLRSIRAQTPVESKISNVLIQEPINSTAANNLTPLEDSIVYFLFLLTLGGETFRKAVAMFFASAQLPPEILQLLIPKDCPELNEWNEKRRSGRTKTLTDVELVIARKAVGSDFAFSTPALTDSEKEALQYLRLREIEILPTHRIPGVVQFPAVRKAPRIVRTVPPRSTTLSMNGISELVSIGQQYPLVSLAGLGLWWAAMFHATVPMILFCGAAVSIAIYRADSLGLSHPSTPATASHSRSRRHFMAAA